MTTGRMFKELRELSNHFVEEGYVIVRPTEGVTRSGVDLGKLSEERITILYNLFNLIFHTDVVSDEVREYIYNRDITAASIAEKINKSGKKEVTEKQVAAKLQYEKSKLEKELGTDIVFNTTHHLHEDGEKEFIEKWYEAYKESISKLTVSKSNREDMLKNLCVRIDSKEVCESIETEEYAKMINVIKDLLIVSSIKKLQLLSDEQIGYLNFLLSDIRSSDSEVETINNTRRATIKGLLRLGVDDITTEDLIGAYESCLEQAVSKFGNEESGSIMGASDNLVDIAEEQLLSGSEALNEELTIDEDLTGDESEFHFDNE